MWKKYQSPSLFPHLTKEDSSYSIWVKHFKLKFPVYITGFLAVIITNLTQVLTPKFIQWELDLLKEGTHSTQLIFFLVLTYVVQALFRALWRLCLGQQSHIVCAALKNHIWEKSKFFSFFKLNSELNVGTLMNIATSDNNKAKFLFGFTLVGTIDFIFLFLFSITAMFMIHWKITLYSLILVPLLPVIIFYICKKESEEHEAAQKELSTLSDQVSQAIHNVRLQKLSGDSKFWHKNMIKSALSYKKKKWKLTKTMLAFIPGTGLVPIAAFFMMILFSIPQLKNGSLSLGEFIALSSYLFLIAGPLIELGWIASEWQVSLTSLKRVLKIATNEERIHQNESGISPGKIKHIEFRNFSHTFEDAETPLIQKLNVQFKAPQKIGIRGKIGSGKTTFLQCLAGLRPVQKGTLYINNHDILDINSVELRKEIAFVSQETFLFSETIFANMVLDQNYSEEKVWQYLRMLQLEEDIQKFPNQLQTSLGEDGVNLSGGQKQRLCLARALMRQPSLLIIDDALNAVDTITEDKILNAIEKELKDSLVIWSAHRVSTLKKCSQIFSFDQDGALT